MIERIARAKHDQYLRDAGARGPVGSSPAQQPWDLLSDDLREANREFARGVVTLLRTRGIALVPDRRAAHGATPPPLFAEQDIEELARAEHDRWMRDRAASGWRFGVTRDDADKRHPDMVAWEDLTEAARDKDRTPMRELGDILSRAGVRAVATD